MSLRLLLDYTHIYTYTYLMPSTHTTPMPPPIKKHYTITGTKWNSHRLEIQNESSSPIFWVNSNNKYGPWKDPYMTIHRDAVNGEIVAAAKMGCPGWKRDFRIWMGCPDCTDLKVWPVVRCFGRWSHEYRFEVDLGGKGGLPVRFAWRRTRDGGLGASGKWHRDFKLVVLDGVDGIGVSETLKRQDSAIDGVDNETHLLDLDIDEKTLEQRYSTYEVNEDKEMPAEDTVRKIERVLAVYLHDPKWGTNPRQARIDFFALLPPEVELYCLTVVMGLQEKISRSQDAFTWYSLGYGGALRGMGNYV